MWQVSPDSLICTRILNWIEKAKKNIQNNNYGSTWTQAGGYTHGKPWRRLISDEQDELSARDAEEFHVTAVIGCARYGENGRSYYLVRWDGYSSEDDSWEPLRYVNALEAYESYAIQVARLGLVQSTDSRWASRGWTIICDPDNFRDRSLPIVPLNHVDAFESDSEDEERSAESDADLDVVFGAAREVGEFLYFS